MSIKKPRRPQLLSATRPRAAKSKPPLSSRTTRSLVRNHHTLRKRLSYAEAHHDVAAAAVLRENIEELGGLRTYQEASLQGQSAQRGGDSSRILVHWLSEAAEVSARGEDRLGRLRMLEVGALRIDNACSRSGLIDVERIDLHSQHPAIEEQDFMLRSLPTATERDQQGFDVVSLSLVVNFVGDAVARGDMLKRVDGFLRRNNAGKLDKEKLLPCLFFVLPAACVTNSRYLDEERLMNIFQSLGFLQIRRKMSKKLLYLLLRYKGETDQKPATFGKVEVRPGGSRNNFAIVLR